MNTDAGLRDRLSDAELDELDSFLSSPAMEDSAMDVCTLEGFAAALVSSPRVVLPSVWLPWVWDMNDGVAQPKFDDFEHANRILALVMRHYNSVASTLNERPAAFEPLYRRNAHWGAAEWCEGFAIGMHLRLDEWAPLMAAEPDWFAPIRILGNESAEEISRRGRDEVDALVEAIVPSVLCIHAYSRAHAAGTQPTVNTLDIGDSADVWPRLRERLEFLSRPFPIDAIAFAEAHRDEVAPHLVAALEEVAADPGAVSDDYMLHLYAMHLLAWWRDGRAFRPLLALASGPDQDLVDDLLGDHITEGLGRCLASVSGGDLGPIKELIADERLAVWVRSAGLDALAACVAEGDADHGAVVAYLADLAEREATAIRSGRPASDNSGMELLDLVVSTIADLGAVEHLSAIRGYFAEELLDESFADLASVERDIADPVAVCLERLRVQRKGYVADPVKEMALWAAFTEEPRRGRDDDVDDVMPWAPPAHTYVRDGPKVGRNDPCPCGSGKKYKKCHGAV